MKPTYDEVIKEMAKHIYCHDDAESLKAKLMAKNCLRALQDMMPDIDDITNKDGVEGFFNYYVAFKTIGR